MRRATVLAGLLVGALMLTGAVVGMLSGAPPLRRALRQLAVGVAAASVTWTSGAGGSGLNGPGCSSAAPAR